MTDSSHVATSRPAAAPVVIERTYRASVADLWDLWTTKDGFESWWGPEGFRVEVHVIEARDGGRLHYDMLADAPEQIAAMRQMGRPISHASRASFSGVQRHQRLTLTHVVDFLPGIAPYDSTITAEFFPSGDRVRMVVTLSPMHTPEFSELQKMGFTSQLTKLDKRFGAAGA